jgi:D-alanyl-D-alanine carboxypeptidase/D-alanyl-D-alanine-endopeptidase (penicillin-binding protein 4)
VTRGRSACALLALAAACAGLLVWTEVAPRDGGARTQPSATPVLSLRRLPPYLARIAGGARLRDELDRALAAGGFPPAEARACLVVHDASGRALYGREPGLALPPASTVKLLTAAAVLRRIGGGTRLVTEVRTGAPVTNGVVEGDLWLVGGGDPLLATDDFAARAGPAGGALVVSRLDALADRIVAAGVRAVRGRLLGDETRYDRARSVPTWRPEYVAQGQSGPLSALSVNRGFTRVRPTPLPAAAPATHAATTLAALLAARGVRVAGTGEGDGPDGTTVVAALESLPVGQLVTEMLQASDNTTAELLTKELGFRFAGRGTTAAGVGVIRATVESLAPGAVDGMVLRDGSGLDRGNRATCGSLTALLDTGVVKGGVSPSLPVAAESGTLIGRFVGTAAAGRIRAKTGSLEGVAALSGYARGGRGEELSFTLLVNDNRAEAARALLERVGLLLIAYPDTPPPSALGPRPG